MRFLKSRFLLSIWIYLGWFACVLLGKNALGPLSFLAPLGTLFLAQFHFQFSGSLRFRLFLLFLIGFAFDTSAAFLGIIETKPPTLWGILPTWLISLWMLFVISLPLHTLAFKKHLIWASLAGAIFGPLSYKAGASFDVLKINGNFAIIVYLAFWSLYYPFSIYWVGEVLTIKTKKDSI